MLITAPALDVVTFAATHDGLLLTAIGRVVDGPAGQVQLAEAGRRVEPVPAFDHFDR